jgi:hypothetical protein
MGSTFFDKVLVGAVLVAASACSHIQPFPDSASPDVPLDPSVRARVILLGDAGRPDRAVLATLRTWSGLIPDRTSVVFLGDNVYEDGLPAGPARTERALLDQQIAAVGAARGVFVPGNHDWHRGRAGVRRQARYVQGAGALAANATIEFLPRDGCPGPAVDTGLDGIRLVAIDTQWLMQATADASGCDLPGEPFSAIAQRVEGILEEANDELVVVVAHHSPWTYGAHGGFFDWHDHVFPLRRVATWAWIPLPLIGSLYPLARRSLAHDQDAYSQRYRSVQAQLAAAFSGYQGKAPLIFAGGHDHSLQVLGERAPWDYVLVSGSASAGKLTAVTHGADTIFAHLAHGFIALDLHLDGRVLLRVIEPGEAGVTFAAWLDAQ